MKDSNKIPMKSMLYKINDADVDPDNIRFVSDWLKIHVLYSGLS